MTNHNTEHATEPDISTGELEQLRRVKLLEEVKQEVVNWAKRQAWLLFIVISILGAFGITLIIKSMVGEQVNTEVDREVGRLEAALLPIQSAALEASMEADRAKEALSEMEKQRERVREILSAQEQDAIQLRDTFADLEADINNLRQGLRVQSENLQAQVKSIVGVLEKSSEAGVDIPPQQQALTTFQSNSEFSILVFYRHGQSQLATAFKESLLSQGFRSSMTLTDFSELSKIHPKGTIFATHTKKGRKVLSSIEDTAKQLDVSGDLIVQKKDSSLRRGDAQVLIF